MRWKPNLVIRFSDIEIMIAPSMQKTTYTNQNGWTSGTRVPPPRLARRAAQLCCWRNTLLLWKCRNQDVESATKSTTRVIDRWDRGNTALLLLDIQTNGSLNLTHLIRCFYRYGRVADSLFHTWNQRRNRLSTPKSRKINACQNRVFCIQNRRIPKRIA